MAFSGDRRTQYYPMGIPGKPYPSFSGKADEGNIPTLSDVLDHMRDHSPLDGFDDSINGSIVDDNSTLIAQVLDGTDQVDIGSFDRVDFLAASAHSTSEEGIRIISKDDAAASVKDVLRFEWDPGNGGNLSDGTSGIGMVWYLPASDDAQTEFAAIDVINIDDTASSEDAKMVLKTIVGGSIVDGLTVSGPDLLVGNSQNVGVGVTAFGTSATDTIGITADGTVPSSSPAGMIQIFANDSSDGATNATLAIRTEQAVEAAAATSNARLQIWINGTEYYLALEAV